ncbi:MAG: DUF4189 domain-containing protein [Acidobacteriaceae bacterium]
MSPRKFGSHSVGIGGALRIAAAVGGAVLVAFIFPAGAWAQAYGCWFDTQTGVCVPYNNGNQGSATVLLYWAAIAVSPTTLVSGTSHGQNSEDGARQLALRNCASRAKDCKIVNWGSNTCFALAVSLHDIVYGEDFGASRAQAASKALAQCRSGGGKSCFVQAAPCASDDARWPPPLPLPPGPAGQAADLDRQTVGIWKLSINPGYWVLEIAPNGTYEFHSEADDGAQSQAGTFSARDGHWSMHATNGYSDGGTYKFLSPNVWEATGKLGTGTWRK